VGKKLSKSNYQGEENQSEILLTVKEVSAIIQETPHVVRNWLKELKPYIPLQKNESGYNVFNEEALERLKLIKQLHRQQNYSIKQIEHYLSTDGISFKPVPNKGTEEKLAEEINGLREEIKMLREYAEEQREFNKTLVTKLQQQQEYIENKLEDRDQHLVQLMRDTLETKKEIALAEEKKKKWQFWK
jgi:DNA-binding transcriptional MerR regulator